MTATRVPPSSACTDFFRHGPTRRQLLQVGGLGFLGLSLPGLLAAAERASGRKARARAVIFLHQFGGPSQTDTFDMKPSAPDNIRGEFKPAATNVPGLQVCDRLPRTARVMDKVCVVRS